MELLFASIVACAVIGLQLVLLSRLVILPADVLAEVRSSAEINRNEHQMLLKQLLKNAETMNISRGIIEAQAKEK